MFLTKAIFPCSFLEFDLGMMCAYINKDKTSIRYAKENDREKRERRRERERKVEREI